jgi:hypothetical protein
VSALAAGIRQWAGHFVWGVGCRSASLAADISLAMRAGHRPAGHLPAGRQSFRKQRTVNPLA